MNEVAVELSGLGFRVEREGNVSRIRHVDEELI